MATIQTAIRLNDLMSSPIREITNAMNSMLGSCKDLDGATKKGFDENSVKEFNDEVEESSNHVSGLVSKVASLAAGFLSVRAAVDFVKDSKRKKSI